MIKPRITLLTSGPSRGLWRCESENPEHHPGACFGKTPLDAYQKWVAWQAYVRTGPFAFLGVAA